MTAGQVATSLEWSGSKVSRIENAKQFVSPTDVRDLLVLYGLGEDEIEKYVTIARQAKQRDWSGDMSTRQSRQAGGRSPRRP